MNYRDFYITNRWWSKDYSIMYNGKELRFDTVDEVKTFIDSLY